MAKGKVDKENIIFAIEHCLLSDSTICEGCYQDGPGLLGITCKKNVIRDALELLKEQEALPIVYQDNPYTGLPVAHCPKCGKFARQYNAVYEDETKFCPYCGQEVKWE